MKTKTTLILSVFMLLVLPLSALAQDVVPETTTTDPSAQSNSRPTQEELDARKAERRQLITDRISAAKLDRVEARCDAAQSKLTTVSERLTTRGSSRADAYSAMFSNLQSLLSRLTLQGVDTAELQTAVSNFETAGDKFFVDYESLVQAVNDASQMDCSSDPEGFYLALQEARLLLKSLKTQASDIHEVLRKDIVSALENIKTSLSSEEGA